MHGKRSVGFEVKMLSNQIRRTIDKMVSTPEYEGLTGIQNGVLGYIMDHEQEQEMFQRDIEQEFHIRRSTATVMLQGLEEKGFICRIPVKQDARLKKIIITEKAVAVQMKVRKTLNQFEEMLLEGVSDEEEELLLNLLERLRNNLEKQEK